MHDKLDAVCSAASVSKLAVETSRVASYATPSQRATIIDVAVAK